MEGVTKRRQFFVLHFLLKLECDPQEIISREICLHSRRPLSDLMGPETKTSRDLVARPLRGPKGSLRSPRGRLVARIPTFGRFQQTGTDTR